MSSTYFLGSSSAVSAPFWDFPGLEYWIQGMSSIKARLQSIGSLFDSTFPLSERKGSALGFGECDLLPKTWLRHYGDFPSSGGYPTQPIQSHDLAAARVSGGGSLSMMPSGWGRLH